MKRRSIIPIIIVSYVIVLGVNILGNYRYYAAGNDWRFSVFFSLGMTTVCWVWFLLLHHFVFRKLQWHNKPTQRIVIVSFLFAMAGAFMTVLCMKAMVLILHFPGPSMYDYINNSVYTALFSMVIGLMLTAQQFLVHLRKSIEDNERMKREMIVSQYEALKSQVNPHFLFNSLNTLLVMIPRQPGLAVNFVEQMSRVFRYSLRYSNDNTVNVSSELTVADAYLFLNKQRYEQKLTWEINISEQAMNSNIITQSLLMLVENAIKHNEISHERPLRITIRDEGPYLMVSNTLQQRVLASESMGMGLANIRKRYGLVTGLPVVIDKTDGLFTVKIPLV